MYIYFFFILQVVFCSSFCCIQGLSYFHRQECNILPTLAALDMGKNSVLAYRILTHTTHKKLKALMPELLEESKHKAPESLGFNTQGIYSSSDYKTIYHLVHNKEQRSVSDLFKRCAMALTLTKLMIASKNHFVAEDGKPVMPTQEDILLTGCTLFIHMMNLPCNAHSVTELEVMVHFILPQREFLHTKNCVLDYCPFVCSPCITLISFINIEYCFDFGYITLKSCSIHKEAILWSFHFCTWKIRYTTWEINLLGMFLFLFFR